MFYAIAFFITSASHADQSAVVSSKLVQKYDNFILVKIEGDTSFSDLAALYLNDLSKGWMISEFNDITTISKGQEIIIPLKPFRYGGITADGYQTVPVLTYTRFSKEKSGAMIVSEASFREQMQYLKDNNFHVIPLHMLADFFSLKGQIPKNSIVITIDDGWRSFYEIAMPVLKEFGYPATIFLYTDFINGKKALSWKQIIELAAMGFDIQSHTKTHRDLVKIKPGESMDDYLKELEKEIGLSKTIIAKKINRQSQYLAYNYGKSNNIVIAVLKKNEYKAAFTVERGGNPFFQNEYLVNRSMIFGTHTIDDFKKNLDIFRKLDLR